MANENRYFSTPFAENGNKAEVPNVSVGGAVGYDTGFGPDYELTQDNLNAKNIERDLYNGMHNSITKNLKQWQESLYPTWIEDNGSGVAFPYSKGMIVSNEGKNWLSNEDTNQEEPGAGSKWKEFNEADNQAFRDSFALKIFQSPTDGGLTEIQTRTVAAGEVYEVRKASDDSLATIYSDSPGTTEIVQDGTDNVSDSDGVVEFFVAGGGYYVEVGGVESNFSTVISADKVIYNSITSAILTAQDLAPNLSIRAFDTSNLLDSGVDHTQILQDAINFSSAWGFKITLHAQQYNYTELLIKNQMWLEGSGTNNCFLVCSLTAGSSDPIKWSIMKEDDGLRARNVQISGVFITRAISGVTAAQDANPNLGGLCLAACEDSVLDNIRFGAFGQGGIVLARAENGAEGLGFTNTNQDGNYNNCYKLSFSACGKYNTAKAACWLKYKANSNNFYGLYGKGLPDARTVGFTVANNNNVFGGTAESSLGIASFDPTGEGGLNCSGNNVHGMRAEGVTGDGYYFAGGDDCSSNGVYGGYLTGVGGVDANYNGAPSNTIDIPGTTYKGGISSSAEFPPSSNADVNQSKNMEMFNVVMADSATKPLYRSTREFNVVGQYVEVIDYNTIQAAGSGSKMSSWGVHCNDTSTGGKGVNARIEARTADSAGSLAWYISAGRESDGLTDVVKISKDTVEILDPDKSLVMSSPDGTKYKLTPPNGGGSATWEAV